MDLPLKQIKNLLKTLEDGGASEFEYEDEKVRVRVSMARGAPMVSAAHAPQVTVAAAPAHAAAKEEKGDPSVVFITSPFVGTFYRAPAPDADPFVEAGGAVKKGQTLCIVEAMKLMNEIECDADGVVAEIYPKNAQPVEYGEALFGLRAD